MLLCNPATELGLVSYVNEDCSGIHELGYIVQKILYILAFYLVALNIIWGSVSENNDV